MKEQARKWPWSYVALFFVLLTDADNRKVRTDDVIVKIMHVADPATIGENRQQYMFKRRELRISLEKTDVMWIGHQSDELNYVVEGNEIKQVKDVCRDKGICK